MKALADSWQNMKSIPARCGIEESFEDITVEVRRTAAETIGRCARASIAVNSTNLPLSLVFRRVGTVADAKVGAQPGDLGERPTHTSDTSSNGVHENTLTLPAGMLLLFYMVFKTGKVNNCPRRTLLGWLFAPFLGHLLHRSANLPTRDGEGFDLKCFVYHVAGQRCCVRVFRRTNDVDKNAFYLGGTRRAFRAKGLFARREGERDRVRRTIQNSHTLRRAKTAPQNHTTRARTRT